MTGDKGRDLDARACSLRVYRSEVGHVAAGAAALAVAELLRDISGIHRSPMTVAKLDARRALL